MKVNVPKTSEVVALAVGYLTAKSDTQTPAVQEVIPKLQVTNAVFTWSQNAQDTPGSITAEITVPSLVPDEYYLATKCLRISDGTGPTRVFDMITELGEPSAAIDENNTTLFLEATIPSVDPTGGLGGLYTGEFVVFQSLIVNSKGEYVGFVELEPYQLVGV